MRALFRRLLPAVLALMCAAPALQAMPIYIFPFTIGYYQWKDLDGKCVSSCNYGMSCPCWPVKVDGFWINVP